MFNNILYQETHRPQFHFTAKKHWINDPNGLVYFDGEYHLYFQHTPGSMVHGRTTWGHAVSTDLVHWKQLHTKALDVDEMGWMWSGSAVVDYGNTGGFQTGVSPPLLAFYTAGGGTMFPDKHCIQCIAFSNDRGRSWTKYTGNPIIEHIVANNRDPKVIWHRASQQWIMTLFLDGNDYTILGSRDLKTWIRLQNLTLPGVSECPDFFELPVDSDCSNTKWVFWGASGGYLLGRFDGQTFTPETNVLQAEQGANGYAAQTWSNISEQGGRCIQISWMRGGRYPGMPFNQQLSFPVELTLRSIPQGIQLFREPVREIERLHATTTNWPAGELVQMANEQFKHRTQSGKITSYALTNLRDATNQFVLAEHGDLFDIYAEIEVDEGKSFVVEVQGHRVEYDGTRQTLTCFNTSVALRKINKCIRLQLLVDRTSLEIFGNRGEVSMSFCFLPAAADYPLVLRAEKEGVRIVSLTVHELHSAWEKV